MSAIPAYDVVIAGGSYAGLAAARVLGGRALVIDQHEIGAIQHSACGTPLDVVRRFGGDDCVLQSYDEAFIHTWRGVARFPLAEPYCIFDHTALCRRMFAGSGADFLRARVLGLDGQTVETSAGPVRARMLVDASGWPAALASARRPELKRPQELTLGIEAEIPGHEDGIHFFINVELVRAGYAWIFPAGDELRVGLGSFDRTVDLKPALQRFLEQRGLQARPRRGGLIPWFQRPPVVEGIFLAGDAAGHCLPLTAEGIRFALYYGDLAGGIVRRVLDGELSPGEGERLYIAANAEGERTRARLRLLQGLVPHVPNPGFTLLARTLASHPLNRHVQEAYGRLGLAS